MDGQREDRDGSSGRTIGRREFMGLSTAAIAGLLAVAGGEQRAAVARNVPAKMFATGGPYQNLAPTNPSQYFIQ